MSRQHVTAIAKLMRACTGARRLDEVFADAVEAVALSIANAIDFAQAEAREARYLQLVKRYEPADVARWPQMLAQLVDALEEGPADILGAVFGELEQGNSARGQFFTPYEICRLMAGVTIGDGEELRARIRERGFVTVQEPAVGAGAMVIAFADEMQKAGLNYQQQLHVTAVDVDARAVHMAFVQLSLLHIPAQVVVGNTLTLEQRELWRTPAHVMGLWDGKLRRGYALGSELDVAGQVEQDAPEDAPRMPEPGMPVALPAPLVLQHPAQADLFEAIA